MSPLFSIRPRPKTNVQRKQPPLVILFTLLCFILGGALANAQSGTAPEGTVPDVVVAVVNGQQILKSQIDMSVAAFKQKTGKDQVNNDEMTELVKSAIRRHLILSLPQVQGYRSDPQIIAQLREYENHLIISKYLTQSVGPSLNISNQQIRDYYDKNRREFATNPKVEARHILLKNKSEAQQVLKLLKSGQDFSDLAKQYSIDLPMALEGGSMGIIEKGRTHPTLEKALFSLAEEEVSDIVETQFGYHIIIVDKIHPAGVTPFDAVHPQIQKALIRRNEARAFDQMTKDLEKNADVTIYHEILARQSK